MAAPIVLILGSGPRVGAAIASKFSSNGYKVAIVSRKGTGTTDAQGYLSLKADFAQPDSIAAVFAAVRTELKAAPSVVIYNAGVLTPPSENGSPLSISLQSVTSDMNINTISAYAAAQQTLQGWASLPKETKKTFIYTGNLLNTAVLPVPLMQTLGMGKAASAYWVGLADATYSAQGYRFFYADERHADGKLKGAELDGPAHGEFYAQLASHEGSVPWQATFVKDKGYVQFK